MAPMQVEQEIVATGEHQIAETAQQQIGIEGMNDSDRQIGNIVLVQGNNKAFKGVPSGSFANSKTGAVLSSVTFIPVHMSKFFDLYDVEQAIPKWLGRYFKESAPELSGKRWQYDGKLKPEVIPVISVVALVNGSEPCFIRFKKTSGYPAGQNLYTMIRAAGGAIFGAKYSLKAIERTSKDKIDFYAIDVAKIADTTDEEKAAAHALYLTVAKSYEKVHGSAAGEEETPF